MKNGIISKLLGLGNYWSINKDLAKKIGLTETILLQHLIELQYNIFDGNEFFQQNERILEELPISEWQLKQSRNKLVELGLITLIKKGIPCKYYYTVLGDNVIELLTNHSPHLCGENLHTSAEESSSHIQYINKKDLNKKDLNKNKQQAANKNKQQAANKNIELNNTPTIESVSNPNTIAETAAGQHKTSKEDKDISKPKESNINQTIQTTTLNKLTNTDIANFNKCVKTKNSKESILELLAKAEAEKLIG